MKKIPHSNPPHDVLYEYRRQFQVPLNLEEGGGNSLRPPREKPLNIKEVSALSRQRPRHHNTLGPCFQSFTWSAITTKGLEGFDSPKMTLADYQEFPLAKQLEYLAGEHIAGIVLGARVPIVRTSRADTLWRCCLVCDRSAAGAFESPEAADNSPRVMKSRRNHAQNCVRQFRNIERCPDDIHWPTCFALGRTSRRRRR
jgi:hypothetical protein